VWHSVLCACHGDTVVGTLDAACCGVWGGGGWCVGRRGAGALGGGGGGASPTSNATPKLNYSSQLSMCACAVRRHCVSIRHALSIGIGIGESASIEANRTVAACVKV
jgi:hypothetical protein